MGGRGRVEQAASHRDRPDGPGAAGHRHVVEVEIVQTEDEAEHLELGPASRLGAHLGACRRPRDLVGIGDDDEVIGIGVAEREHDGVALVGLALPGAHAGGKAVQHDVVDPVGEAHEARIARVEAQRLGETGMGLARLDDDEAVDRVGQLVQPDLEDVQLPVEHEAVIDAHGSRA